MSILYKNHPQYPDFILIRNFTGKITVNEIIDSWDFLLNQQLLTDKTKGVINNLTKSELDMNIESFSTLINYLKKNDNLKRLKLAVICDTPGTTVFPMLGELRVKELNIKPFSTEEAAISWIMDN